MGLFSRDIGSLDDLFVHTLRDIHYAERRILTALPDMIGKTTDPELQIALRTLFAETEGHVRRIEDVFVLHGAALKTVKCHAIEGIMAEAEVVVGEVAEPEVMDATLAACTQAMAHYKMSRYGTLVAWARRIGRADCAALLQRNLDEEKAADRALTGIAETKLNVRAAE